MNLESFKNIPKTKIIHIVSKWCIPCQVNKKLLHNYNNHVIELDYDENQEIMKYKQIIKVPTVLWNDYKIEGISTFKLKQMLKLFDELIEMV